MAAFLLWNVNRNPIADGRVQNLVRQFQIDIVLLVEYPLGTSQLPGMLDADGLLRQPSSERFGVFVRDTHQFTRLRYQPGRGRRSRANFWRWVAPSGNEGLVVLVHGPDRRNHGDDTRRVFFRRVADAVQRHEARRNHRRSLIAGDFNAHPFDSAVVAADGLHALGVPAIRGATDRAVGGERVEYFYNPMWRAYGHEWHPAAGAATYHRLRTGTLELGWHMLDQVVIRPSERIRFPESELRILSRVGADSLLDADGLPDARNASDHLPLVFHWNL